MVRESKTCILWRFRLKFSKWAEVWKPVYVGQRMVRLCWKLEPEFNRNNTIIQNKVWIIEKFSDWLVLDVWLAVTGFPCWRYKYILILYEFRAKLRILHCQKWYQCFKFARNKRCSTENPRMESSFLRNCSYFLDNYWGIPLFLSSRLCLDIREKYQFNFWLRPIRKTKFPDSCINEELRNEILPFLLSLDVLYFSIPLTSWCSVPGINPSTNQSQSSSSERVLSYVKLISTEKCN